MTVDQLVAEGDAYRLAHPTAPVKALRSHLIDLPTRDRDDAGWWGFPAAEPEGCLVALLLSPVIALVVWLSRRRHAGRVDRAMAVLTADRPRKRKRRNLD